MRETVGMRRKDRELTAKQELLAILDEADVCRIALATGGAPYIVPLNFGFVWEDELTLYFHSASEGRKIDLLQRDNRVGFEIDTAHEIVRSENACKWSMRYKSLVGTGAVFFIEDEIEREFALNAIIQKYGHAGRGIFNRETLQRMAIYKLIVEELSGKQKK